jgi:hypothetical protein
MDRDVAKENENSMPDESYKVGDHVQVYLDSQFWKSEGWYSGTVLRLDPYSEHRSFIWVELDTPVLDARGGASSVISVLNPKRIKLLNSD